MRDSDDVVADAILSLESDHGRQNTKSPPTGFDKQSPATATTPITSERTTRHMQILCDLSACDGKQRLEV
jgi:hypothetical protein